jgi:hypothetical protein
MFLPPKRWFIINPHGATSQKRACIINELCNIVPLFKAAMANWRLPPSLRFILKNLNFTTVMTQN